MISFVKNILYTLFGTLPVYMKRLVYIFLLIFLLTLNGCVVFNFSTPGWKGSVRENSISEGYKPAVNIYFGKKERFFVIPFFFFEWNKGDYAISFDFASACETYDKIDFINYKIIFNTNTGQSEISGSIIGGNKGFFKCYSDYGYYGKSTRCYAMLKSEYNIKQLMADPIHINVDFDVYITDKNKQGVMLKYRDSKLSIVKESKVKFFIIENY